MALTYTELKDEIQLWLDNNNPNVITSIPIFIEDAEHRFSRKLRCVEQECFTNTVLTSDNNGYDIPSDCIAFRFLYSTDTHLHIYYWQKITPLSDINTTNWLLTKHPDLYRLQALLSAEGFIKNDPRIPLWKTQADEALADVMQINNDLRYSGDSLVSKVSSDVPWYQTSNIKPLEYLESHNFDTLVNSNTSQLVKTGYYTVAANKIRIWPNS